MHTSGSLVVYQAMIAHQEFQMLTSTGTFTDLDLDLTGLDLATISIPALAAWLQNNGASHLRPIERIELAERLITRRRFLIGVGALGVGAITGCGPQEQASAPPATVARHASSSTQLARRYRCRGRRAALSQHTITTLRCSCYPWERPSSVWCRVAAALLTMSHAISM
ncbi:hypothetical protein HC891_24490 [Candidatus Gracilibacteria bacterium]|nr:hypothetical protein [Candidatus Gracilibacteria bacterium]